MHKKRPMIFDTYGVFAIVQEIISTEEKKRMYRKKCTGKNFFSCSLGLGFPAAGVKKK